MAQGLFRVGFTLAEIKNILARAKEQLLAGKTIMEWEEGDVRSRKEQAMPIKDVLAECQDALQYLDPATYGRVITRTVPDYSGGG